jgi:hypothetical protein
MINHNEAYKHIRRHHIMEFANLNDAILQALADLNSPATYDEVYKKIIADNYYQLNGLTPASTVSAHLSGFIKRGDVRVARIKDRNRTNNPYIYYLTANQDIIDQQVNQEDFDDQIGPVNREIDSPTQGEPNAQGTLLEKSLHRLLITYLASSRINIHALTIPHEMSNRNDKAQTWTHPDIVGVEFINLHNDVSRNLQRAINTSAAFKISSIEVKISINSDKELKEGFFQAVSNSSWANYGYLAALEFRDDRHIRDEMERLNESFGIGFIEISATAFESKILYPSRHRELDFKTIDKLCGNNEQFRKFIENINNVLHHRTDPRTEELYYNQLKLFFQDKEIDKPMAGGDIINWCKENNIPLDEDLNIKDEL